MLPVPYNISVLYIFLFLPASPIVYTTHFFSFISSLLPFFFIVEDRLGQGWLKKLQMIKGEIYYTGPMYFRDGRTVALLYCHVENQCNRQIGKKQYFQIEKGIYLLQTDEKTKGGEGFKGKKIGYVLFFLVKFILLGKHC